MRKGPAGGREGDGQSPAVQDSARVRKRWLESILRWLGLLIGQVQPHAVFLGIVFFRGSERLRSLEGPEEALPSPARASCRPEHSWGAEAAPRTQADTPRVFGCSNCLLDVLYLATHSHPLSFSRKGSRSPFSCAWFTRTHKHTWPQAQLCPLSARYSQGKNSHRCSETSPRIVGCFPLTTVLKATRLFWIPGKVPPRGCVGRGETCMNEPCFPSLLPRCRGPAFQKLQGTWDQGQGEDPFETGARCAWWASVS